MSQAIKGGRITRLRLQIEQERWEEAISYLQTKPGAEESRIFTNGDLPLHYILRMKTKHDKKQSSAPLSIIQALLGAFPDSILVRGRNGQLPLHVATHSHVPVKNVLYLIRVYPGALTEKDETGRCPNDYDYDDKDKILERQAVCYKTQDALHEVLRKREQKFCQVLPKFQNLHDRQRKLDKNSARFEDRIDHTLQSIKIQLKKSDDYIESFMRDLGSIQDEIDEFLNKINIRMGKLELGLEKRNKDQSQWDREENRRRIEWYKQLRLIDEEVESLRKETKDCGQLLDRTLKNGDQV